MFSRPFLIGCLCVISSLMTSVAQAHFIWLSPDENNPNIIHVRFSEDPGMNEAELLPMIKNIEFTLAVKEKTVIKPTIKGEVMSFDSKGEAVLGNFNFGKRSHGGPEYELIYHTLHLPRLWSTRSVSRYLKEVSPLMALPEETEQGVIIDTLWQGEPAKKAEIHVLHGGVEIATGETNDSAQFSYDSKETGLHAYRVKWVVPGKTEDDLEQRHYMTVTFPMLDQASVLNSTALPELPLAVTSFGAARTTDGTIFAYGGNAGEAHNYYKEAQSNQLIKLTPGSSKWEVVDQDRNLQGLALVAAGDSVYRIGGFQALNTEEEESNLKSRPHVVAYNAKTGEKKDAPQLPEPRSSHDAAVIGDTIYVVGGWKLDSENEQEDHTWHETAWKLDTSKVGAQWEPIANPPFQRRALAVAAFQGKLFVIGGIENKGWASNRVDIYDPKTDKWSQGPDLLDRSALKAFGCTAFAVGDQLLVSTINGDVQQLSEDQSSWSVIGRSERQRFFHRLLPVSKNSFVMLGGGNMDEGRFVEVDQFTLPQK